MTVHKNRSKGFILKLEIRERPWDLVAAVVIASILVAVVLIFPNSPLRLPLGLLFVLFLPGYVIVSALFPKEKDLGMIERIALSFGLSIAVVPLVGLLLNYTPWGIRLEPILVSLLILIVGVSALAYYRRINIPIKKRFGFTISIAFPKEDLTFLDKALVVTIVILLIASCGTIYYMATTPKEGEKFTEFYILGPEGKAENYPATLSVGGNGTVIIGVVNHEYANVNYTVEIALLPANNTNVTSKSEIKDWDRTSLEPNRAYSSNVSLNNEEKWEQRFTFNVSLNGSYKLQFNLYKLPDSSSPYRELHLWLTVKKKSFESGVQKI